MSYVVCSNIPDDEDNLNRQGGAVDDPFRFRNHLGSTFTIPKNGQVALESAKIQMDGSIDVSGENVLYQYFGKELEVGVSPLYAASLDLTTSVPIRTVLDTQGGSSALSPADFASAVASSCAREIYQPLLRRSVVGIQKFDAATEQFTGYQFDYEQGVSAVNDIPITQTAMAHSRATSITRGGQNADNFTYGSNRAGAASAGEFFNIGSGLVETTSAATFNVGGISDKIGTFEIDVRNVVGAAGGNAGVCNWFVGLGRPVATDGGGTIMRPPSFSGNGTIRGGPEDNDLRWLSGYADYGVFCNHNPLSAKADQLQVMHTAVDDTRPGTNRNFKALPFEYNEPAPDNLASNYDLVGNLSRIEFIKFVVDGETITIQGLDKTGGNTFDIVRYDATRNKELNLSATGQHRWHMVPILALNMRNNAAGDKERSLIISEYTVVGGQETTLAKLTTNEPYLFQDYRTAGGRTPQQRDRDGAGHRATYNLTSNWQQSLILQGNSAAVRTLGNRVPLNYGVGLGAVNPYEYDFAVPAATDPLQPYSYRRMFWILGRSDEYGVQEGSTLSKKLGFDGRRVILSTVSGADGDFVFSSSNTPELVPTRSIFVRLDNFALASTNARQGGQSRIIGHLPRFSGNQSIGSVFYQPSNLIYIDLNNSEEMKVNSFDISLCFNDEKFVESLAGATIICLHFKSKDE